MQFKRIAATKCVPNQTGFPQQIISPAGDFKVSVLFCRCIGEVRTLKLKAKWAFSGIRENIVYNIFVVNYRCYYCFGCFSSLVCFWVFIYVCVRGHLLLVKFEKALTYTLFRIYADTNIKLERKKAHEATSWTLWFSLIVCFSDRFRK